MPLIAEQDVVDLLREATNNGRFITRPELRDRLGITMSQDGMMRGLIKGLRGTRDLVVISKRGSPGGYRFALSPEEKELERDGLRRQAWTLLAEATAIDRQVQKDREQAEQMEMEFTNDVD